MFVAPACLCFRLMMAEINVPHACVWNIWGRDCQISHCVNLSFTTRSSKLASLDEVEVLLLDLLVCCSALLWSHTVNTSFQGTMHCSMDGPEAGHGTKPQAWGWLCPWLWPFLWFLSWGECFHLMPSEYHPQSLKQVSIRGADQIPDSPINTPITERPYSPFSYWLDHIPAANPSLNC